DRTDWTRIDVAVRVTANRAIHGTDVETRAAANAPENLGGLAAAHPAAAVVEQHDVELFGSIAFAGLARAVDERRVDRQLLSRRGSREHFQASIEIGQRGNQLF